ncbi:MAG: hypothetical protein KAS32_24080 [Candidatus Peribacteraceae bacterium]|nr:hypothetical protein [Candidatus Peribacteraceae bacterium]
MGGSGREIFESDLFRVVVWGLQKGIRTSLTRNSNFHYLPDINFEGRHALTSDTLCMEQLEVAEIVEIIENEKEQAFEAGQEDKILEFKRMFHLR